MADSLLFDGIDDVINLSLGGTAFAFGPGTMCAIVKLGSDMAAYASMFTAGNNDNARYGIYRDPGEELTCVLDTSVATTSPTITVGQGWQLVAFTKATGSVAPRAHRYLYGTDTWTHVNSGTSLANSTTPAGYAQLGQGVSVSPFDGNILIAGVWNTELSDGTIETLKTGLQQWVTAAPREAWRLDSMSAIQSFGSVGTADESSRTGTTLDTGDVPAGWSDTLGGGGPTPPYVSSTIS